jgi:hypothetical protein
MLLKQTVVYTLLFVLLISSCSRKHIPEIANKKTNSTKPDSVAAKRAEVKRMAAPKIIAVNDKVAKKSVDGRLYYDVNGHRYWKNYNDGKYYLFNQSMYTDSAFKPH